MKRRKVAIIGSSHPLRGGLASYNERLAAEYIKNGDDVTIYTFKLQYPDFLFPGKTQYSNEQSPKGLNIKVVINSINPFNWLRVGWKIRKQKPDIVIIKFWIPFMGPCLGTLARIIRSNRHTKIISIIDNIIPHEKRVGDKILAQYFVNSVHGFIAMSRSVLVELDFFDKRKPKEYCPHPLFDNFGEILSKDRAKEILKLDKNTNYILFFGFIRDYKGLDLLLKAIADERFKALGVKLIVAGEFYSDSQTYFDLIEKYNLQDIVIIHNDFIPDSKVGQYFCSSDLVVQPYKSATQSGVTQIAYHFNKPMIVTDVGGLSELVPDGKVGYVVKTNPDDIANAIVKYYENKEEEEYVENVKMEKLKYSWASMLESINKIVNIN